MFDYTAQQLQAPLEGHDIFRVVGGLWNAESKGDQAYFFKRKVRCHALSCGGESGAESAVTTL